MEDLCDLNLDVELESSPKEEPEQNTKPKTATIHEPLFFDIETVPDYSRMDRFGFEPIESYKVRNPDFEPDAIINKTLKDIEKSLSGFTPDEEWIAKLEAAENGRDKPARSGVVKIIADLRSQQDAVEQATADQNKTMSVTPEFCRIVAIGFAFGDEEPQSLLFKKGGDEAAMLQAFWLEMQRLRGPLVGYNILGFDLPVIFTRSALLGVKPTRKFDLSPWKSQVIDLMKKRFPSGRAKGLKDLAQHLGIDVDLEGIDGSQVLDLFNAGDHDTIHDYVCSDVTVTRRLFNFWNGYFFDVK